MKDKVLTEEAKKILKQEYGKARENYVKITEEIKKIIVQINKKLSKN